MNATDITKSLKRVGGVKAIADEIGVSSPTVSQVIHRVRPNPRIRQAIAKAIGKPVEEVFPDKEAS